MTSRRWIRAIVASIAVVVMAIPTSGAAGMPPAPAAPAASMVTAPAPAGAAATQTTDAATAPAPAAAPAKATPAPPAAPSLTAAPVADPSTVGLAGTLRLSVADDFANGRSQTFYSIETASGSTPITVSGGSVDKLDGAFVHVSGHRAADGSVAVDARSFVVEKTASANPDSAAAKIEAQADRVASPAAPKTTTIAVVIADYTDLAGYPVTVAQASSTFNDASASVHSFFDATSRGRINATATIFGPWHLGIGQCPGGVSSWSFATSMSAALNAAVAHGDSLAAYDHVVLWTRAPCLQTWAGEGQLPGKWIQMDVEWAEYPADEPAVSAMVASHELGHNLGLAHADGLACFVGTGPQVELNGNCSEDEYMDQYSTMGMAGSPVHALLDADRLATLGWLGAGESKTVTAAGTYSLVPVYSAAAGVRLLRIIRPTPVITGRPSGAWTLELRSTQTGTAWDQFAGWPYSTVTTGVTVRYSEDPVDYNQFGPSYLVDTVVDGNAWNCQHQYLDCPDYWDAPLQAGGTVSDSVGGFTITVNSVGPSGASITIGDTMAPTAPLSLEATSIPTGGAELDWQAATDNLGLAHYRIYRDGSRIGEVSGATLDFTDPPAGLGGPHTYAVRAVDTAGLEGAAATASAVLAPPPSAPLSVTATPGNGAALVRWSAPASGAPITSYAVTSQPGGRTCTTTGAMACVVAGLANGTPYTFSVRAANSVGFGPVSSASNSVTPLPVPGRPTAVSGTPGDATVTVTWTAPSDPGSGSIVGYTVTSSPDGKTCSTGGAIRCSVTQLTDGVAYTFTVTATNSLGPSLPSVPSIEVTPRTRSNAPVGVAALGSNGSALVSWSYPPFDGGSPVTEFDVVSAPGGRTCHTTGTRSCTVTGLTNRVAYTFRVTATNVAGTSGPSAASPAAMPLAGATYVTVTPNRLADSRTHVGLPASLIANAPAWFQVTGRSSDPELNIPEGAVAVTGNLTAVSGGAKGYFSLTPDKPVGTPATSTLNFPAGDIRANAVTVPLGTGGKLWVTFVAAPGKKADAVFDVTGYFIGNSGGATYLPLTPNRLMDSRIHLGLAASLIANAPASFQVTGRSADPARNVPSNAVAVTGNLTAVNEGAKGYFSLTPNKPVGTPATSTLNFPAGDIRANGVTVPLGAGGKLWVTFVAASGKKADAVFDVTGYFVPNTSGATYVALTPNRLVDSRGPKPLGLPASLVSGTPVRFTVTDRSVDVATNVPADAVGVTGNMTAVGEGSKGYYSLTPDKPAGVPGVSTVNFPAGDIRANAVTVPLGSGGVLWVTFVGAAGAHGDVVFDVSAYFTMH